LVSPLVTPELAVVGTAVDNDKLVCLILNGGATWFVLHIGAAAREGHSDDEENAHE
jgi:hypothetical protein